MHHLLVFLFNFAGAISCCFADLSEFIEEISEEKSWGNLKTVVQSNFNVRSVVYLYDDSHLFEDRYLDELIGENPFYSLEINREGVHQFNGIYNDVYNDSITWEQSKMYLYQVKLEKEKRFLGVIRAMRKIYFYRARDKLILLIDQRSDHFFLVNCLMRYRIVNVIFAYPNGSVFTFDFLEKRTFFEIPIGAKYFYDKLQHFQARPIRISMFSHVRDAIPLKGAMHYDGRDGLLANSFMNFMNATGVYFTPTDGITYGENKGNRTITGVFGDVARNHTDVALNSRFMKNEFENVVEYTYPHDTDDLVVLVPCGNADTKFEYYKSFEGVVWLSVAATNLAFLLLFVASRTFRSSSEALLHTFGIFLGQSYSSARSRLSRIVLFMYTLYAFLVLVHYSSLLMSIITVPHKPKEIDTFEELAASKLNMYTVERYKRYLILYGEKAVRDLKERIVIAGEKEVMQLIDGHGEYAVITKRSTAEWSVIHRNNYKNGKMIHRIMKKSPFPTIVCYITKYGSPLKDTLNRYMESIRESGINGFWKSMTLHKIFTQENKHYKLAWNLEKKIDLGQLSTIFFVYILGIFVSIGGFLAEIMYKKYNGQALQVTIE